MEEPFFVLLHVTSLHKSLATKSLTLTFNNSKGTCLPIGEAWINFCREIGFQLDKLGLFIVVRQDALPLSS